MTLPHLQWDWAHPSTSAPGLGLAIDRKQVRLEDGTLKLLAKGADNMMLPRLQKGDDDDPSYLVATKARTRTHTHTRTHTNTHTLSRHTQTHVHAHADAHGCIGCVCGRST